jgi:hypothetical protein
MLKRAASAPMLFAEFLTATEVPPRSGETSLPANPWLEAMQLIPADGSIAVRRRDLRAD